MLKLFEFCRVTLRVAVTASVFVGTPSIALAQWNCSVDQLPREPAGRYRLAIRINGIWQVFGLNETTTAHVLENVEEQQLCLAWEAPPYQRSNRQIVYVSTQYRTDQPLWLSRSSAAAGLPFVGRLLGDWGRSPGASGDDPDRSFRMFHRALPVNASDDPWNNLADWHDTSAWLANTASYELVSLATEEFNFLPYGTERLLMLAARRPLTSWVPFTSFTPSRQQILRVAVSYSGDLENFGPRVYRYEFEVR